MSWRALGIGAALLVAAAPALADWNPGDPYKMHWPQLPDPAGIDVSFRTPGGLADDWTCTRTGPVSDVHFWFSQQSMGQPVPDPVIYSVHLSVHANMPPNATTPYPHPGELLWEHDFSPTDFTWRPYGTGVQGWLDPVTGEYTPGDHYLYYQMNITNIADPFEQSVAQTYWLDVSVSSDLPLGWKTSWSPHFKGTAVWGALGGWQAIYDPRQPGANERLDLAFVITPEPAALVLLGVGMLLMRRR